MARPFVKALPGGRVNTTNDLLKDVAESLKRELGIVVDINPIDPPDVYPRLATLRAGSAVEDTYWTLFRAERETQRRGFGLQEGYSRIITSTFEMWGYYPIRGTKPSWSKWNDYTDDVCDAIEACRKLSGNIVEIPPPNLDSFPLKQANEEGSPFLYHSARIRFVVWDMNKLLFPPESN